MRRARPDGNIPLTQRSRAGRSAIASHLIRWGGLAVLVAGVLFVLGGILILIAPPQRAVFNSFSDYLSEVILVVAFALTLVAITGLHALQSGRYGRWGAAGSLITFIGYALIVVVTAVSVLAGGQALYLVRLVGAAAVLVGSALPGGTTPRTRGLPG